jgi:putative tricarboxylic transport membrane protein
MWEHLLGGFANLAQPMALLVLASGVIIGYFVGAMPGLTGALGLALLMPFTFGMDPVIAIIFLSSAYMASEYGGAITAILINTPGTASSAPTALDGYPLALQGKAGKALGVSIIASGFGNFVGSLLLMLAAIPVAAFALRFGGPEYFALAFLGLSIVSSISTGSAVKGWISALFGLLICCIGIDRIDGIPRFVPHWIFLGGVPFVPAMVGLFAVSEVMVMFEKRKKDEVIVEANVSDLPNAADLKSCIIPGMQGTIIGYIIGVIPAVGISVAAWLSYDFTKRYSKHPEMFGKGSLEGIASCEASNNAAVAGAMVPTLTLGVPGTPASAILIAALMIQGLQPGPLLFTRNPEIPYAIFATFLVSGPIMTLFGLFCAKFFAKVTLIPRGVLAFIVLGICFLGTFALDNSMFNVWIAFAFGLVGYAMKKFDYPIAPTVLAMILGPILEYNFRLALLMGRGSFMIFLTRPIALTILILTLFSFIAPLVKSRFKKSR